MNKEILEEVLKDKLKPLTGIVRWEKLIESILSDERLSKPVDVYSLEQSTYELFEELTDNGSITDRDTIEQLVNHILSTVVPVDGGWIGCKDTPAPEDREIERWHKIYKCVVSVKISSHNHGYKWTDGTLSMQWPEESFLPYWREKSQPPTTQNQSEGEVEDSCDNCKFKPECRHIAMMPEGQKTCKFHIKPEHK